MLMRRLGLVLVGSVLVLGACSGGGDDPEAAAPSASPSSDVSASPAVCGTGGVLGRGLSSHTMDVDGTERSFAVYAPPGYDGTERLPVVYLVHGLGGVAETNLQYTGLAAVAERESFIVVAPQAAGAERRWDYRTPLDVPGSDAAFLRALMDETVDRWCVDGDRQYAAGVSNGSAVVFAMACSGEYPVQAYGGVAAAFYEPERCDAAPPADIVYFHGTADPIVPFQGGPTPIEPVEPTPQTLAAWAEHDGCTATPETDDVAADVELQDWQDCEGGSRLEAYIIEDGGHTWPGAVAIPGLGETTTSIDASEVMAEFFDLAG